MMKWLKMLIKYRKPAFVMRRVRDSARYEQEKQIAATGTITQRMVLALNPRTHQEILYYMAEKDADPAVRRAVARNLSSPIQASMVMAADQDQDVRLALAERLIRLLPELSREDHVQLYAIAVQALGTLAQDEVLNIRIALSSTLKDHAFAPPAVVRTLARDVERQVAEPVLRFCAALPDDLILEILQEAPQGWAVEAIANRKTVSEPVAVAIIDTGLPAGGKALLENPGAAISEDLLREIVQRARYLPEWQEPLALRKGLPPDLAGLLAEFAHDAVRDILLRRNEFDSRTTDKVTKIFQRRLRHAVATRASREISHETAYDRAIRLAKAGTLHEDMIADALALQEDEFVIAAIACRARTSLPAVRRIFAMHAPKPIVALSWKAGLSMRMALQLQRDMGRVPFQDILYPRGGTDYPLSEEELLRQLDFLGLKVA